jgi:hypothetical protein
LVKQYLLTLLYQTNMTNKETEDYGFLLKGRQVGDSYWVDYFFCSPPLGDLVLRETLVGRTRLEAFAKASATIRGHIGGYEWHELLRSME